MTPDPGVGVAVPLAHLSCVSEPHTVRVGGKVTRVDSEIVPVLWNRHAKLTSDPLQTGIEQGLVLLEFRGEAVERIHGGRISENPLQSLVFCDEGGGSRHGRDRVERLGDHGSDQRADRVAPATSPTFALQVEDETPDFGRAQNLLDLGGDGAPVYPWNVQGGHISLSHAPEGSRLAGAFFAGFPGLILVGSSDGKAHA